MNDMIFPGLLLAAVLALSAGHIAKNPIIAAVGGFLWIGFGAYCYSLSAVVWDLYYVLFWVSMFIGAFGGLMGAALVAAAKNKKDPDVADEALEQISPGEKMADEMDDLYAQTHIPRMNYAASRGRLSAARRARRSKQ